MRELMPWVLFACALATLLLLLERRRRNRLNLLDDWAARNGLFLERHVGAGVLAHLEPLTLVAPVVDVQRQWHGRLNLPASGGPMDVWLASCLVGTQHRPRQLFLGIFDAPSELPQLRLLPSGEHGAPDNLGFAAVPGEALPPGYRLEAFMPLPAALIATFGPALQSVRNSTDTPEWHIELRPGRLLLATFAREPADADRMMELALALRAAFDALNSQNRSDGLANF